MMGVIRFPSILPMFFIPGAFFAFLFDCLAASLLLNAAGVYTVCFFLTLMNDSVFVYAGLKKILFMKIWTFSYAKD
jgi:hypothetical protein